MRRYLSLLIVVAVALVVPVAVYGYTGGAGMIDTPHDFVVHDHADEFGIPHSIKDPSKSTEVVTFDADPTATWGSAVGLCAFCHTPHRAIKTALLWNHTMSTQTYNWVDTTTTIGGTTLPTAINNWAGPSKLCLSCHDGTVAIGDINWYQAKARTGTDKLSGFGGKLDVLTRAGEHGKYNIADGSSMQGNHPVAIPYAKSTGTYNGIPVGGSVGTDYQTIATAINSGVRLFVDNGSAGVVGAKTGDTANVGIECSSCHDPHNGASVKPDPVTDRPRLVRGTVFGDGNPTLSPGGTEAYRKAADGTQITGVDDYLCVKCHKKTG